MKYLIKVREKLNQIIIETPPTSKIRNKDFLHCKEKLKVLYSQISELINTENQNERK